MLIANKNNTKWNSEGIAKAVTLWTVSRKCLYLTNKVVFPCQDYQHWRYGHLNNFAVSQIILHDVLCFVNTRPWIWVISFNEMNVDCNIITIRRKIELWSLTATLRLPYFVTPYLVGSSQHIMILMSKCQLKCYKNIICFMEDIGYNAVATVAILGTKKIISFRQVTVLYYV